MNRWVQAAAVAGVGAAAFGGWWAAARHQGSSNPIVATTLQDTVASRSPFAPRNPRNEAASAGKARETPVPDQLSSSRIEQVHELSSDFSRRQALYALAAQADVERLKGLIAAAKTLSDAQQRRSTLEILLLRYAELDRTAALRSALDTDRLTASQLVASLAASDAPGTWDEVARIDDPLLRTSLEAAVIGTWAAAEPRQAFARVASLPFGWQRNELLQQVTAEIARRDPRLALELVKNVESDKTGTLETLIAGEWGRVDPSGAARWIEGLEDGKQAPFAYGIANAYVIQRPAEALAWALRISKSPGRNLWSSMLGMLAQENPTEALRIAQSAQTAPQRMRATSAVLGAIALRDPALAYAHLQQLPASMRVELSGYIAQTLAAATPAAAVDWLERIEDRQAKLSAAMRLAYTVASRDPDAAASFIDRVPQEARRFWIGAVAHAYVNADIERAQQWASKHQAEVPGLKKQLARSLASRDPAAALEMAGHTSNQKERDQLLAEMLPAIARSSADTATQWLDEIDEENLRTNVVAGITQSWAHYDEPAARKWVMSLENGAARDQGIAQILSQAASVDDALSLIKQIGSPDQRMDATMQAAIRMRKYDPDGARTLLRRQPLDPQRQQIYDSYPAHDEVIYD